MKAPDKIYVDKFGQSIEGYIPEGCSLVTEYIRKDALLEWVKERREEVAKEVVIREGVRLGADAAFEELIDKLNEM